MAFENHVATVVCDTKDVYILDWRDKSGTNEYYVRYIVDKKLGSLIIQGDLGTAVACWYSEVTLKSLVSYVSNVPYFASKLLCSTDKYVYNDEDINADIVEYFDNLAVDCEGDAFKEVMDDCYAVANAIIDAHHNNVGIDAETREILEKYDIEDFVCTAGRRLSERVKLWSEGFVKAYEEVSGND